jgi:hypothetical protein
LLAELPAGAATSELFAVSVAPPLRKSARLFLRARYSSDGAKKPVPGVSVSTLDLIEYEANTKDMLAVDVRAEPAVMHESDGGRLLFTLRNGSDHDMQLVALNNRLPPFLKDTGAIASDAGLDALASNLPILPAHSSLTIERSIATENGVTPGKYLGWVDVQAKTACRDVGVSSSYEVALNVFGEAALLTAVGVPLLLLLPGFLMISAWILLSKVPRLHSKWLSSKEGTFPLGKTDPDFWMLGVSLSLALFALAPGVPGVGFQAPYRLEDIARIWLWSVIAGLGSYLLLKAIEATVSRWRKRLQDNAQKAARKRRDDEHRERTLTPKDEPVDVVRRMRARNWPIEHCVPVRTRAGLPGFKLWPAEDAAQTSRHKQVWVVPQIVCTPAGEKELPDVGGTQELEVLLHMMEQIQTEELGSFAWRDGARPRLEDDNDNLEPTQGAFIVAGELKPY